MAFTIFYWANYTQGKTKLSRKSENAVADDRVATRCQILRLKCTKSFVGWGSTPNPAGGAYSAPPDHLAGFWGPTSKEGERRRGEGRRRERRRARGRGGEGKGGDPLLSRCTPCHYILDKSLQQPPAHLEWSTAPRCRWSTEPVSSRYVSWTTRPRSAVMCQTTGLDVWKHEWFAATMIWPTGCVRWHPHAHSASTRLDPSSFDTIGDAGEGSVPDRQENKV